MIIRSETAADASAIHSLVTKAFEDAEHSDGNEAKIVDGLRDAGSLTVSLVAEIEGIVVGHVAFSPVAINEEETGWYGLGPVSVSSHQRRKGVANALIKEGVNRLKELEAGGCVVLGDPDYYGRFGFEADPELRFSDVPPEYFQRLVIGGEAPKGAVDYHPAFFEND